MSATTISSANAKYSKDYYYKSFYTGERNARISANRGHYSTDALIKADANALKKAAQKMSGFEYEQKNGADIFHAVQAFADTYNNALSSTSGSGEHSIARLRRSIKSLTAEDKNALSKIGITIKSNGSLEINKETLSSSRLANVKKVFSESSFTKSLRKYAKNLYYAEYKANLNNNQNTAFTGSDQSRTVTELLSSLAPTETEAEAAVGNTINLSL